MKLFGSNVSQGILAFRNLKSLLVRPKVWPLESKVGSAKCFIKRCQVCLNINETDTFESFQAKFRDRSLVYVKYILYLLKFYLYAL